MTKIQFDERGYLRPYEITELNLQEFERIFVEEMEEVEHRRKIFQKLLDFNQSLIERLGVIQYQYINGSFTTKKDKPGDIDVTTFIDYRVYRDHLDTIESLLLFWEKEKKLDVYLVEASYPGHPRYRKFMITEYYWATVFGSTRENKDGKRLPKGFIKINYDGKQNKL